MKKLLFITILFAIGCGSQDPSPQTKYEIAPELSVQVESFYTEAALYGHTFEQTNLVVKTIESGSTISRYYVSHGQRVIEVLILDPSSCQELPLFREMARALMGKAYTIGDEIMNPDTNPCVYVHTPTGEFYESRAAYLNQLFQ